MALLGGALGCGAAGDGDDPAYAIIHDGLDHSTRRVSIVSTLTARGTAELETAVSVPLPAAHSAMFTLDERGVAYAIDLQANALHETSNAARQRGIVCSPGSPHLTFQHHAGEPNPDPDAERAPQAPHRHQVIQAERKGRLRGQWLGTDAGGGTAVVTGCRAAV